MLRILFLLGLLYLVLKPYLDKKTKLPFQSKKEKELSKLLYPPGTCLAKKKTFLKYTKIVGASKKYYTVARCHKYKGCDKGEKIESHKVEFEHKDSIRCAL